jgi:hypothetical protein
MTKHKSIKFCAILLVCGTLLLSVIPVYAVALLTADDMSSINGGCNGNCAKRSNSCWEGCVSGECMLKRFCADYTDYHYICQSGSSSDWCTASLISGGCGDLREDGNCSGIVGQCINGKTVGQCNRNYALGIGCR